MVLSTTNSSARVPTMVSAHPMPVAVDGAGGDGLAGGVLAVDGVDGAGGKQAGEQRAHGSTNSVDPKGIEGVVVAEEPLDPEHHEGADQIGDGADGQGAHGLNKAGGLGDGGQSGDGAGDGAKGGGLAVLQPLGDHPADGGGGGGELGVDKGAGGQRTGIEGAAGVEAEPAEPEQTGADEAEHQGVGRHVLLRVAGALAQIECADQGGNTGGNVD